MKTKFENLKNSELNKTTTLHNLPCSFWSHFDSTADCSKRVSKFDIKTQNVQHIII